MALMSIVPLSPVYEIEVNVKPGVNVMVGAAGHIGVLVTEKEIEKGTESMPSWTI